MGLFDSIKNIAVKAKCAVGFHAGEFKHIPGEPACHYGKTCSDCNKFVTLFKHKFQDNVDYVNSDSCTKQYRCSHCDFFKETTEHEGYTKTSKDSYCKWKLQCTRCKHEKAGEIDHYWLRDPGSYDDENEQYTCYHCNKKEIRKKIRH